MFADVKWRKGETEPVCVSNQDGVWEDLRILIDNDKTTAPTLTASFGILRRENTLIPGR
jgi:hypothetical protein